MDKKEAEPDILARIYDLNRVKLQLLISWLSHKEIELLINACDQVLEDYILDNLSRSGRDIVLQGLGFSEAEFQDRKKARLILNNHYLNFLGSRDDQALKGSERRALQGKARELLTPEEKAVYETRFYEKSGDLGEGLARKLEEYVGKLEKGQRL